MKYIKQYEGFTDNIEYKLGDIVICINDNGVDELDKNKEYKIIKIFKILPEEIECDTYIKNDTENTYVDVKPIDADEIILSVYAWRFIGVIKFDANKYNL